jgi:hypothetical protein
MYAPTTSIRSKVPIQADIGSSLHLNRNASTNSDINVVLYQGHCLKCCVLILSDAKVHMHNSLTVPMFCIPTVKASCNVHIQGVLWVSTLNYVNVQVCEVYSL